MYFIFKHQLKHIDLNLKTFAFLSKKASSKTPKASKPSSIVPLSNTPCAEKLILTFICNVRSSCLYNLEYLFQRELFHLHLLPYIYIQLLEPFNVLQQSPNVIRLKQSFRTMWCIYIIIMFTFATSHYHKTKHNLYFAHMLCISQYKHNTDLTCNIILLFKNTYK